MLAYTAIQYILFVGLLRSKKNPSPDAYGYNPLGVLPSVAFADQSMQEVLDQYASMYVRIITELGWLQQNKYRVLERYKQNVK